MSDFELCRDKWMTRDLFDLRWRNAAINAFKPVSQPESWLSCPKCGVKPRAWEFDNGSYAACLCSEKYARGECDVSSESIGDYYRRLKTAVDYDHDGLRKNWNARCEKKLASQ